MKIIDIGAAAYFWAFNYTDGDSHFPKSVRKSLLVMYQWKYILDLHIHFFLKKFILKFIEFFGHCCNIINVNIPNTVCILIYTKYINHSLVFKDADTNIWKGYLKEINSNLLNHFEMKIYIL